MTEDLVTLIDWTMSRGEFKHLVDRMVNNARRLGKVLPLPIALGSGRQAMALLTLLQAQINCEGCSAPCCRGIDATKSVDLLPPEIKRLEKKYPGKLKDGKLIMPCLFLKNNRCEIHSDRPLVCAVYPWQPGGRDGTGHDLFSIASSCPEARRLVKRVFMAAWEIRQAYARVGDEFLGQ